MNTEHLKYLLEIASCKSINQAAENLNFQRQYLSKILSSMEKQLGVTIFERNPKGVALTIDGTYFIEQAEQIVQLTNKLEQHFQQISAVYPKYKENMTFFVPDVSTPRTSMFHIVASFQKQFPNMEITLKQKSGTEVLSAIKQNPTSPGTVLSAQS